MPTASSSSATPPAPSSRGRLSRFSSWKAWCERLGPAPGPLLRAHRQRARVPAEDPRRRVRLGPRRRAPGLPPARGRPRPRRDRGPPRCAVVHPPFHRARRMDCRDPRHRDGAVEPDDARRRPELHHGRHPHQLPAPDQRGNRRAARRGQRHPRRAQGGVLRGEAHRSRGQAARPWHGQPAGAAPRPGVLMSRRGIAAIALALAITPAAAQISGTTIRIGVLTDISSLYADGTGMGSVAAARLAAEDSGLERRGIRVEVLFADHYNKPDVGLTVARRWYDVDGVDVIVDVPNSSVALGVSQITREKNRVLLASGAGSSDLTGKACSPNPIHWTYDTWMLANGTARFVTRAGGDTWYFITADYAFGHALERDASAAITRDGGRSLGAVRVPLNTADFGSFLLQAQASKAKVIGLANAGGAAITATQQAAEFGS